VAETQEQNEDGFDELSCNRFGFVLLLFVVKDDQSCKQVEDLRNTADELELVVLVIIHYHHFVIEWKQIKKVLDRQL